MTHLGKNYLSTKRKFVTAVLHLGTTKTVVPHTLVICMFREHNEKSAAFSLGFKSNGGGDVNSGGGGYSLTIEVQYNF